ncbi:MAG: riboflavin synthase [Patescibacteria group bacterium]|nr:riboflavin synthase [Patescibacteria group bacterium]
MFAGIVEKTGKIQKIEDRKSKIYFTINVKSFLKDIKIGSSISCDGACLTVVKKTKDSFIVELMPETLKLTKFINSKAGDLINLEKSLKIGERIDGHFVMGHVDGVGIVKKIIKEGKYIDLIIKVPQRLIKYLAYKGSASINGVSLTIAGNGNNWFKVCLITHTLDITNLSTLKTGDKVNIEVDMIARYLERLI